MMRKFWKFSCFAASIIPCRISRTGWICRWRRTRRGFRWLSINRHCEERQRRSNPACFVAMDCFASLAMTMQRLPLLNHARAQNVVQVHDADRLVGLGTDRGGVFGGVGIFRGLAG